MEKGTDLSAKGWYRTLKVLYIIANIVGIGFVVLLAYTVAYQNPFLFLLYGTLIVLLLLRAIRSIFLYIYNSTPFWSSFLPKPWLITIGVIVLLTILASVGNFESSVPATTSYNNQSSRSQQQLGFQPAPSTPTQNDNSNSASPTSSKLNVAVLPTMDGINGEGMYADKYPSSITLTGSFANQVGAYGAAYQVWIAPEGWTGQGQSGADGSLEVDLYPIGGSAKSDPHITYSEIPACVNCMIDAAAPYFASAMQAHDSGPDSNFPITIPAGLEVTPISPTLITYTLPSQNGMSVNGVVYYNSNSNYQSQQPPFAQAEFVRRLRSFKIGRQVRLRHILRNLPGQNVQLLRGKAFHHVR